MTGCVTTNDKAVVTSCPPYPIAGATVARELETLDPADFPNFIEWMQRIDKLAEQLEVTR